MTHVSNLPVDCLELITARLDSEAVYNLWKCGDRRLSNRLEAGGVLQFALEHRNYLQFGAIVPNSKNPLFPVVISRFQGLHTLSLLNDWVNIISSRIERMKTTLLPKSLTTLRIRSYNALHALFQDLMKPNRLGITGNLDSILPNLKHLSITTNEVLELAHMDALPKSLLSLSIKAAVNKIQLKHVVLLPGNLLTLEMVHFIRHQSEEEPDVSYARNRALEALHAEEQLVRWPSNLRHLRLCYYDWHPEDLGTLPSTLLALDMETPLDNYRFDAFSYYVPKRRSVSKDYDWMETALPKSLQSLSVNVGLPFSAETLPRLPPDLTELTWDSQYSQQNMLAEEDLQKLPPKLLKLKLPGNAIGALSLTSLPPGLTDLSFCHMSDNYFHIPANSKRLVLERLNHKKLLIIPASVTDLSCSMFPITFAIASNFPHGLTHLDLKICDLDNMCLNNLPKTLKHLRISKWPLNFVPSMLPVSLEIFAVQLINFRQRALEAEDLKGLENLPRLRTFLILGHAIYFDEDVFAFLPPQLTRLQMPVKGLIRSLESQLPLQQLKQLRVLEMPPVEGATDTRAKFCFTSVAPEAFAHLPNTLEHLQLPPLDSSIVRNTTDYMAQLAKNLPPRLKQYYATNKQLCFGRPLMISTNSSMDYPLGAPESLSVGHYDGNGVWIWPTPTPGAVPKATSSLL